MLALTPNAAEAVEAIVSQPEAPDGAVMRITSEESAGEDGAPMRDLQLALVEEPQEGDVVVQGMAISIEPDTIDFLDDKVLDAEFSDEGVQFSLYLQPEEASENGEVLPD
jgi:Fe-S cluster assembly iron-binding protein IscA